MRGWDRACQGEKKGTQKTWLWPNCPPPFSIRMISLSWHNPSKIAHSSFQLWKFHSERTSFCHCIPITSLSYFSRTSTLSQEPMKVNCRLTQPDPSLHKRLDYTNHLFSPTERALYSFIFLHIQTPAPLPPSSYTPLESWQSMGLLGAVARVSLWIGSEPKGHLR